MALVSRVRYMLANATILQISHRLWMNLRLVPRLSPCHCQCHRPLGMNNHMHVSAVGPSMVYTAGVEIRDIQLHNLIARPHPVKSSWRLSQHYRRSNQNRYPKQEALHPVSISWTE